MDIKRDLSNTFSFSIDMTVPSGETFQGTFKLHRPTVGERIKIGNNTAKEIEGLLNVDAMTDFMARMVATFDVVIDEAPIWWKPRELKDVEVIQAVYEKYINYLNQFSETIKPKPSIDS